MRSIGVAFVFLVLTGRYFFALCAGVLAGATIREIHFENSEPSWVLELAWAVGLYFYNEVLWHFVARPLGDQLFREEEDQ